MSRYTAEVTDRSSVHSPAIVLWGIAVSRYRWSGLDSMTWRSVWRTLLRLVLLLVWVLLLVRSLVLLRMRGHALGRLLVLLTDLRLYLVRL